MSFEIVNLRTKEDSSQDHRHFAATVLEGLLKKEKRLPSWLIFDDRGSEIFKEIAELKNYHPAVCENEILHSHKETISNIVSREPFQFMELGSGDGSKAMILIEQFLQDHLQFDYIPIDISAGAIENLVASLRSKYSGTSLTVTGAVADYFQGLKKFAGGNQKRNFVLFQGATFGNRDMPGAKMLLRRLSQSLKAGDYVMIGFDLLKRPKLHYRAYNDPQGIFEKFNLHLLDRINRELGANFNIANFVQEGQYNWRTQSVESYVYSLKDQCVYIEALNREFRFKHGEGMQTEQSYKFTLAEIKELGEGSGLETVERLFDGNKYYVQLIWKVK